jgi:hypothetical protein
MRVFKNALTVVGYLFLTIFMYVAITNI